MPQDFEQETYWWKINSVWKEKGLRCLAWKGKINSGSVAKNLAILQNQWKTSQIGYLYAINRSIMIQKAIVIAQKGSKIIFATEPYLLSAEMGIHQMDQ